MINEYTCNYLSLLTYLSLLILTYFCANIPMFLYIKTNTG